MLGRFVSWAVLGVGALLSAIGVYLLARWSPRWLLAIVLIVAGLVLLIVMPVRYPSQSFLDPGLPPLFLNFFWLWVFVFVVGMTFSVVALIRLLRAARPASRAVATETELTGKYPDLEAAWDEIQIQLARVQIDPASQHTILLLAPDEESSGALVHSAGLSLFVEAPMSPAPTHAYATADGVLLSAAGASAFGTQGAEGASRMELLCRRLLTQNPDLATVRGVVVVFPIGWAGQGDSVKSATAIRDDLRTVQRVLKVRCPVFALFTQMELTPGFTEFVARMSGALRQSRCGFAIPRTQSFSGDLVQRGLIWMSGWFHSWILSQMAEDLLNQPGNNALFGLDYEFRRYRKRLRAILESAFSTHRESEPILFRGCYFVGTGPGPNESAFSAGLLRGARGRIFADHLAAEWTAGARENDRHYRRLALAVGVVGGLLTLLAWVYILVVTQSPFWWIGPVVLTVAWLVVILRVSRW
jgi:type VI secretion system protein ImpL